MSILQDVRAPENRAARMCFSAAAATLLLSTVATVAGPLGAQEAECDVSFDFENVQLQNNATGDVAGPFDIEIEAGTYTVTVVTSDNHDVVSGGLQLNERVHLVTDSGYRSAATDDIPADVNEVTTVFTGQTIDASTSLTIEHAGLGGINSLFVDSVNFTSETPGPCGATIEIVPLPVCEFPEDDAVIDGFGYENGASCEVPEVITETVQVFESTNPTVTETVVEVLSIPACEFPEDDAVIDGFGYENGASCEVPEVITETVQVFESANPTRTCLLYTSPSPRDQRGSRMPSSA